jgi:hypothetical protein
MKFRVDFHAVICNSLKSLFASESPKTTFFTHLFNVSQFYFSPSSLQIKNLNLDSSKHQRN